MAGRASANKQLRNGAPRRRLVVGMGAGAGVFLAAAAMATGSAVTAAPAKADIDALIDPIVNSISDSLVALDPAAAVDITSWTDSLLASLNSIDLAVPAASESAAVAAASPAADPTSGTYDIPITIQEDTEPTVQATVAGSPDQTLLVDTGSSGLVIPWENLGTNDFTALENLFDLGFPTGISESGYSGGVQYIYLTYDNATVDYGGVLTTTNTPIDVEILSWSDSSAAGAPANFEQFLQDDDSTGILGVGDSQSDGGPTTSPLEDAGFTGVTVDEPKGDLIVSDTNPYTALATVSGAPIVNLTESVDGGTPLAVSDDLDSGGVYGTVPSSLLSSSEIDNSTNPVSVAPGNTITVYDGNTELYSYLTGTDSDGTATGPTPVSGTAIDSGVIPFEQEPIYIDYANDTLSFDK